MKETTWAAAALGAAAAGTMRERVFGADAGPVTGISHVAANRNMWFELDATSPHGVVAHVLEHDEFHLEHEGGVETVRLTQRGGRLEAVEVGIDPSLVPHPPVAAPLAVFNEVVGVRAAADALWPGRTLPPAPDLTPWLLGPMAGFVVAPVEVVAPSLPGWGADNRCAFEVRETELAVTLAGTRASHPLVLEEVREHRGLTTWQAGVRLPERDEHVRFPAANAIDAVLLAARLGVLLLVLYELPVRVPTELREAARNALVVRPGTLLGGVRRVEGAIEIVTSAILRAALTHAELALDVWERPAIVSAQPTGWRRSGLVVEASVFDGERTEQAVLGFNCAAEGWGLTSIHHVSPASPAPVASE